VQYPYLLMKEHGRGMRRRKRGKKGARDEAIEG
jgi:hypothetical protein